MNSLEVRKNLLHALNLDLVGPTNESSLAEEILPQNPSRWYLTGFLIPSGTPPEKRRDADEDDDKPKRAGHACVEKWGWLGGCI